MSCQPTRGVGRQKVAVAMLLVLPRHHHQLNQAPVSFAMHNQHCLRWQCLFTVFMYRQVCHPIAVARYLYWNVTLQCNIEWYKIGGLASDGSVRDLCQPVHFVLYVEWLTLRATAIFVLIPRYFSFHFGSFLPKNGIGHMTSSDAQNHTIQAQKNYL